MHDKTRNNLPNFLIVGGEKCGTTAMHGYLIQLKGVFIPEIKECKYFSHIGEAVHHPFTRAVFEVVTRTKKDYESLFSGTTAPIRGDASPDYLFFAERSIDNILHELGRDTRIIIMLRDPIDRAYSNYLHLRREGLTDLGFTKYLEVEDAFDASFVWWGFFLKKAGLFARSVELYMNNFSHVKIIYFDDFIAAPQKAANEVLQFIGATSDDVILQKPLFSNKTGVSKYKILNKLMSHRWRGKGAIKKLATLMFGQDGFSRLVARARDWNLYKPPLSDPDREFLRQYYAQDVIRLEEVLGMEVPWGHKYRQSNQHQDFRH